jgi:hypothetical protein
MYAMIMLHSLKINNAKQLARRSKRLANWTLITYNFYYLQLDGYNIYKRNISRNYWQFTIADDITSCTFQMYEKEAKNAKLGNE